MWEAANRDDLFSVTSLKHYARTLRANVDIALTLYKDARITAAGRTGDRAATFLRASTRAL